MKALRDYSEYVWTGDDAELQKQMEKSKQENQILFMVSRYPLGAQITPTIICQAKPLTPDLISAADFDKTYYGKFVDFYKLSPVNPSISEMIVKKCGNTDFNLVNLTYSAQDHKVFSDCYFRKTGDYVLSFIAQYYDDQGHQQCQEVLDTLEIQ